MKTKATMDLRMHGSEHVQCLIYLLPTQVNRVRHGCWSHGFLAKWGPELTWVS